MGESGFLFYLDFDLLGYVPKRAQILFTLYDERGGEIFLLEKELSKKNEFSVTKHLIIDEKPYFASYEIMMQSNYVWEPEIIVTTDFRKSPKLEVPKGHLIKLHHFKYYENNGGFVLNLQRQSPL